MLIFAIILVLSFRTEAKFEYYDLKGNYGLSSKCELTSSGAECLIKKEMTIVNQFNERGRK